MMRLYIVWPAGYINATGAMCVY